MKVELSPTENIERIRKLEIREFVEYLPDKEPSSSYITYDIRRGGLFIGWLRLKTGASNVVEISVFFINKEHRQQGIGRAIILALQTKWTRIHYPAGDSRVITLLERAGFKKVKDGSDDGVHSHWVWEAS